MANRWFTQFRYSLVKAVVDLYGQVAIGASGAPTISVANSKGISSIVRNSAGRYTITLQDSYYGLLDVQHKFLNATAPAAPLMFIVSQAVTNNSAPVVVIQFTNAAGTATDPGSGELMYLQIALKNSSAN